MLIFLVGFMGSGKSYTGRNLAPLLGVEHIDLDHYLEQKEDMSVKQIFEKKGEEHFRKLEQKYFRDLIPQQQLVVSTGGGAPCFYDNMDVMNEKGLTIYLNRSKDFVIQHLIRGQHKRPLVASMNREQLEKFYDEMLEKRKPFYEKARLHVGDADTEEIFKMIENANF